jgi:hypothetical protein
VTIPTTLPVPGSLTPRNKAHGLKNGCVVQRKNNVMILPCHAKATRKTSGVGSGVVAAILLALVLLYGRRAARWR